MKLYVYRAEVTNFGDELNEWLLPRIFPDFFDGDEGTIMLAIGSVLYEHEPRTSTKIVFGSGYGGYQPLPAFDNSWRFYGVRGPRTARACGLDSGLVSGDTAIIINRFLPELARAKRYRCSFMPHWQSIPRGNWQKACELAGIHFIDPRAPVPDVLDELMASEMVLAEAMHGAIVADALRVPWVPILPIDRSHHMKWYDWAEALDLTLNPQKVASSSLLEAGVAYFGRERQKLKRSSGLTGLAVAMADRVCVQRAAHDLAKASRVTPSLSSDRAISHAVDRLERAAERIVQDFPAKVRIPEEGR